jgi:mannose-6-phosphate isomerase-like protein (cupin superfamily)
MSVVSNRSTEHYIWGNNCDGWQLVKSKHLSVIQERVPPNCSEKRHYHERAEQFFFILSGIATIELDGNIFIIHPHNGIHVKAGSKHQLSNQNQSDLMFLVTSTPPSHGDRVDC